MKAHFGVQSALYLHSDKLRQNETQTGMDFISANLTEMKFQTGMIFWCEQNLDFAFNVQVHLKLIAGVISLRSFWQKWNFISSGKMSCKRYPKWNDMKGNIWKCLSHQNKNDWEWLAFSEWAGFLRPPPKRNFISFHLQWKVVLDFLSW